MLISTKSNIKLNFQNNRFNTTNLTGKLCKIGKDKIIHTVEKIVNIINLHNHFIDEAFLTIYSTEYL